MEDLEDTAGTGRGAELVLQKSTLELGVGSSPEGWVQNWSIPMDLEGFAEEVEMLCMIH